METNAYLDTIKKRFEKNFDLIPNYTIHNYEFDPLAKYHFRGEGYLTKKTVIYALENNKYCLTKAFETLDENSLNRYMIY